LKRSASLGSALDAFTPEEVPVLVVRRGWLEANSSQILQTEIKPIACSERMLLGPQGLVGVL